MNSTLSPAVAAELDGARIAFRAGDLEGAARRCRSLLQAHPAALDALTLLGEIEYKRGNPKAAAAWFDKVLALDRKQGRAQWLLGNISQDEGKLDRAITAYRRALRAEPGLAEAHNDLGTAYFAKGWQQEAEQCYRRALELEPGNLAATENLAAVLRAQGKIREARDAFIRALRLRVSAAFARLFRKPGRAAAVAAPEADPHRPARKLVAARDWKAAESSLRERLRGFPEDAEALHLLGGVLSEQGQHEEAIAILERAVALRSSAPEFHITLGNVLSQTRAHAEAIEQYSMALMLDPGQGMAAANIARVLHDLGHFREAEEIYRLSLQRDPDTADAHNNLAATLVSLGRYAEAEAAARKACELQPRSTHALVTLAIALMEQGRIQEAQGALAKAAQLDPRDAMPLRWSAFMAMAFNADFEGAEKTLRQALQIAPQESSLHINLARSLLIRERFEEGWAEYEWRKQEVARARVYGALPYPEWQGEDLSGKTIAVVAEQGLGDEIMFASCLADIASRARRCVLYCSPRLASLFRRSFPSVQIVESSPDNAALREPTDYQIAAGSLPRLLRRSADAFPAHQGYLAADTAKIERWRQQLSALGPGLKAGISWKGGTPLSDGVRRTLALEDLRPLLAVHGVHWVSIQHGNCLDELRQFEAGSAIKIHHWQEAIDDLDELAALLCALDLRITVCNTQVHLSGALGKEAWVLAPLAPDWRYGRSGERMRWYPAVRMFRQSRFGDWAPVVGAVQEALTKHLADEPH